MRSERQRMAEDNDAMSSSRSISGQGMLRVEEGDDGGVVSVGVPRM